LNSNFEAARLEQLLAQHQAREYGRQCCLRDIRANITGAFKSHFAAADKVALLFIAVHANLGDNLLALGGLRLSEAFGKAVSVLCTTPWQSGKAHVPTCPAAAPLLDALGDRSLVLLHAGGNWGSLYRHEHEPRLAFLADVDAELARRQGASVQVVQLPQSVWYNPAQPDLMQNDTERLNALRPGLLSLFVRQHDSLEFARRISPGPGPVRVALSPDVAFMVDPTFPTRAPEVDVLCLLRRDIEGVLGAPGGESAEDTAARVLGPAGLTFRIADWPGDRAMLDAFPVDGASLSQFAELRWRAINAALSQGLVVVTDRLHAGIACVLLGKRHVVLDNSYAKVTGTRAAAFAASPHCSARNLQASAASTLEGALRQAAAMLAEPMWYN
jgi:pyruvyl transferase EpsO